MINKNININHNKNSFKKLLCLLFLFLLFSCEDSGCIDSDDFGEYEIYTFKVNANKLEELCTYKPDLTDVDQGFGIKSCITGCTGNANTQSCRKECEDKCYADKQALQDLFNAPSAGNSSPISSEPNWFGVGGGGNIGKISIEQNSQILITAQGSVNLGNSTSSSMATIINTDTGKSKLATIRGDENITKFSGGENLEINFEGIWSDSNPTFTYFNSNSSTSALLDKRDLLKNHLNYYDASSANGARRIFAYFIPFPDAYQQYQNYNFPLAPDPRAWKCQNNIDVDSSDPKKHLSCSNNECSTSDCFDDYAKLSRAPYTEFLAGSHQPSPSQDPTEIEKKNKYNEVFTKHFNIDNESKETSIYEGGTGFIRYKDDNLYGTDKVADAVPLAFKAVIDSNQLKSGFGFKLNFPNPTNKPYFVKIYNNTGRFSCNVKFEITSNTPSATPSTIILRKLNPATPNNITDTNTAEENIDFANNYIFEPEHIKDNNYMVKAQDPLSFNESCVLIAYFYPFHEIEFTKSGYINFGIVDDAKPLVAPPVTNNTNNCKLKFRIRNRNSKYESNSFTSHAIISTHLQYFVRKGQKLSFSPESWSGEWTTKYIDGTSALMKECGVGFYVNLTPRPAVFCSNFNSREFININQDNIEANNCIAYYDPILKKETSCKENYDSCLSILKSNSSINDKFCPTQCIKKDLSSCRPTLNPSDASLYRYPASCTASGAEFECYDSAVASPSPTCLADPTKCSTYVAFANIEPYKSLFTEAKTGVVPAGSITSPSQVFSSTSCSNCQAEINRVVIRPFYPDLASTNTAELTQCYDIEDYKGTNDELKNLIVAGSAVNKPKDAKNIYENEGIKIIKNFDGTYGNLYPLDYVRTNTNDAYKLENITFINRPGYIKFIVLGLIDKTSSDFFELTNTRNLSTSNLRISTKSSNELSNGSGLNIALCKENSPNGDECSQNNLSITAVKDKFNNAPNATLPILEYEQNNSISANSNYKFNDFGQLFRITSAPIATFGPEYGRECFNPDTLTPTIGKNFLCFNDINNNATRPNYDPSDGNKYRLSFKIIDNETPNCQCSSLAAGACAANTTFSECTPPIGGGTSNCNKFTIINPGWNGVDQGYCNLNERPCSKRYQCISDKYLNNRGYYDVAVKIKRDSKIKVSNFINSIISPVLGEIDGFSINKQNYVGMQTVTDFINARPFNTSNSQNNFLTNTQDSLNVSGDLKPKDGSIINIQYAEGKKDEVIKLDPNSLDPTCRGNCFISYINFAIYGHQNTPNSVSVSASCQKSYRISSKLIMENKCLGKTSCSFIVSETEFPSDTGIPYQPSASCNIDSKKLMVNYTYSISNEVLFKENQAKRIYTSITNNLIFQNFLTLSIVLMFSFYGMGFLMGVSELKQSEIIDRLIKIGLIYLFTSPQFGWIWFEKFFVTFFKNGTDFLTFMMAGIFDENGRIDAILNSGDFSDKSPIFYDVDRVVGLFLVNDIIHKKIASLLFYKFFGIIYVFVIYHAAIAYVYAISNAVLLYLTSQFFTSVLFLVGPFFFVFILFKQTKGFFDNWLNSLIGFSLQQIFLVFTLSLFNTILYLIIKSTLGFKVCWETVWKINSSFSSISVLSFWTPQESPSYINETTDPSVEGSSTGLPTIPMLLSLWTVCEIMKAFISKITDLAASLSGGISASEIGSGVSGAMNTQISNLQKKAGEAYEKSGVKGVFERADQKLFNSGRLAKEERAKENKKEKDDQNIRNQMKENGDKAVSDFKVNNHEKFSKMSEEEKVKALTDVKKKAMVQTAKDMGKSEKQIKDLMNNKTGRQYRGDNVFGLIKSAGVNHLNNGGRSSNEEALRVDTRMSQSEMNKVLKSAGDSDKRKDFIDNVKAGNIRKKDDESYLKGIKDGAKDFVNNISSGKISEAFSGAANRSFNGVANDLRKERKEAVKQLEDSGQIKKQSFLEKRSQKDEEKIVAKMQENKLSQARDKGPKGPNVSEKDIAKLESFSKKLNEKEGEPQIPKNENSDIVGSSKPENNNSNDINI